MRRLLVAVLAVAAGLTGGTTRATAQPIRTDGGSLLSCPDPSVLQAHAGRYRYYLVCTSDRAADTFPIRGSDDLLHWRPIGYVFPAGHHPWWAARPPKGRYWAPTIYRIDRRWVVYFAAQTDPRKVHLRYADGSSIGATFVIGVATSASLDGPWHTKILHYRGQFNGVASSRETYGGLIDPSQVQDPVTGQRYLFWAEQHTSIWATKLSADGLKLNPDVHQVLWAHSGWECRTPRGRCTIEGPEETYRHGWFYLFFSGASTWTGTYAVGAAVAQDPLGWFQPLSLNPILHSSHRWIGPGGTSAPVTAPDGQTVLLYHAETKPDVGHVSSDRYLFVSPLNWTGLGGYQPLVNQGSAG